ncbi:hypothetical protein [Rhodanobacter sp. BL-MT-08]
MKLGAALALVISFATLVAFAGLIPLGRWHDEYFTLQHYHALGGSYFAERLLHWSPRPLSEAIGFLYGLAVYRLAAPLTAEFLALLWLVLLAAVFIPVLRKGKAFVCASMLMALFLIGHPVAEVFYWPFGAVAYMPTLAAAALLLTLDWGGYLERSPGAAWTIVALIVSAISSEVGALFTLIYIVLLIASRSLDSRRHYVQMLVPLVLALAVLYFQFAGRVSAGNEVFGDPLVAHHVIATVSAVAKHLLFELLKGDSGHSGFTMLLSGLVTKLAFFSGVYLVMSQRQPSTSRAQHVRLILIAASLLTATLTMAAALYNFGSACCERHATMRQEYVFIAIAALATYAAARWPSRKGWHAETLLTCSLLIPLTAALPKLKTEYSGYLETRAAVAETWLSGQSAGPDMRILQTMPRPITGGIYIEPGSYRAGEKSTSDVPWMLSFFGKQSATVEPAKDLPTGVTLRHER